MIKKTNKLELYFAIGFLVAFVLWTILVCFIDVKAIGPRGTTVGFASLNEYVHNLTDVNMTLYVVTDWLGLVPIFFCVCFGVLGVIQWIKRKKLFSIDFDILVLGGFYILVMLSYVFFETITINYRPVLINNILETSYPFE